MSRQYVILDEAEVASVDFSQVLETSSATLRWTTPDVSPKLTFVKFNGTTPSFLVNKPHYTKEQLLQILNDIDGNWYQPEPI